MQQNCRMNHPYRKKIHGQYDPNIGHWLTRDPIGYSGGINLYGYVGNNTVMGVDADGLLVEICVRRIPYVTDFAETFGLDPVAYSHWFFNTSLCGARGYEQGGFLTGWRANAGGQRVNCYIIPTTPAQERCICNEATKITAAGYMWLPSSSGPFGRGMNQYNAKWHNCQDFVQSILARCTGFRLNWNEQSPLYYPGRPHPPTTTHRPRLPK